MNNRQVGKQKAYSKFRKSSSWPEAKSVFLLCTVATSDLEKEIKQY